MIDLLKMEAIKQGDKAAVIPIRRLQNIRQDLMGLKGEGELNNFQQYIINDLYALDLPETQFEVRSIIIAASPSPSTLKINFAREGKCVPLYLPASYADKETAPRRVELYLNAFLAARGYHLQSAPRLPLKRIAVCSGLGVYGRNNICFVEGMGSFLNLSAYYSDMPCEEDPWRDVAQMDRCNTCPVCLQNCPTAAITPTRFLIDNERCLTYFNEAGREWNFPDWIDPSSHHVLYGCLRCQTTCPVNRPYLRTITAPVEFTEDETSLILEGQPFELFSEALKQKVMALNMVDYLGALPRNMRVLLNQVG